MKSRWCAMSTRVACQLARVRPCAASYRQGTRAGAEHVAVLGLLYLLDSHQDYDGARTEIVSTSTISSASVASNTASCIRLAPCAPLPHFLSSISPAALTRAPSSCIAACAYGLDVQKRRRGACLPAAVNGFNICGKGCEFPLSSLSPLQSLIQTIVLSFLSPDPFQSGKTRSGRFVAKYNKYN